jgi:S-(hydroxymethyl)mycothiol dehydrogenase
VAVDVDERKLAHALELGATHAVAWGDGPDDTAERVVAAGGGGVDYAFEATGRPEAARAAFLCTRARGAAVLIGIPAADAVLELPALSIPRLERRVLGSLYGSSRAERDFPLLLDLYRDGRLPLDRLVSRRLPLAAVQEGVAAMRDGSAVRVVLDLEET